VDTSEKDEGREGEPGPKTPLLSRPNREHGSISTLKISYVKCIFYLLSERVHLLVCMWVRDKERERRVAPSFAYIAYQSGKIFLTVFIFFLLNFLYLFSFFVLGPIQIFSYILSA
jgi:hypothetical protein